GTRTVFDLRCAVAGRQLDGGPALCAAPGAPRRAGPGRPALADSAVLSRWRPVRPRRQPRAGPARRGREAARLALPGGRARRRLAIDPRHRNPLADLGVVRVV